MRINRIVVDKEYYNYSCINLYFYSHVNTNAILIDSYGNIGSYTMYASLDIVNPWILNASVKFVAGIEGVEYKKPDIVKFDNDVYITFYTPGCYIFEGDPGEVARAQVDAIKVSSLYEYQSRGQEPWASPFTQPNEWLLLKAVNGKTYTFDIDIYTFVNPDSGLDWAWGSSNSVKYKLEYSVLPSYEYNPEDFNKDYLPTVSIDENSIVFDKDDYYAPAGNGTPVECLFYRVTRTGDVRTTNYSYMLIGFRFKKNVISHIQRVGGSQLFCYLEDGTVIPLQRSGRNLYGYGSMQLSGVDYGSYMEVSVDGGDSVVMDYWQKRGIYVPRGGDDG